MRGTDKTFLDNPISKYSMNTVLTHLGKISVTTEIVNHMSFIRQRDRMHVSVPLDWNTV